MTRRRAVPTTTSSTSGCGGVLVVILLFVLVSCLGHNSSDSSNSYDPAITALDSPSSDATTDGTEPSSAPSKKPDPKKVAAAKRVAVAKKAAAHKKAKARAAKAKKTAAGEAARERADERVTFGVCAQLRRVYPHGVGQPGAHDHTRERPVTTFYRSSHIYELNAGLDRDGDGIACEEL